MFDLGSGAIRLPGPAAAMEGELTISQALAAGFDVVTFSGAKLLGGPQAGVIAGRKEIPQRIRPNPLSPNQGTLLAGLPGLQLLDSLAVDEDGWVCVATIFNGGITAISPDGSIVEHHATDDPLTTNVCFGGEDLRTAFVTLSSSGRLVSFEWPRAGLRLPHL